MSSSVPVALVIKKGRIHTHTLSSSPFASTVTLHVHPASECARASGNREGSSHLCVLCVHTLIGRMDVRFSLTSLDAMQRLLPEEGVPLLLGLSPSAWVVQSVSELTRITGVRLSVIAMAFTRLTRPTPQGAFVPTGVTSLPHRRRMRRTASRAAHRLATLIGFPTSDYNQIQCITR